MKRLSLLCCMVLLLNLFCPVGAFGSSTSTDLCEHDMIWKSNGELCQLVCSKCGYLETEEAHLQDCNAPGVCACCGYEGEMETGHVGELYFEYNDTEHWQLCTACDQIVSGPYEHHATCENPTVCADCGYTGAIERVNHSGDLQWEHNETEHWQVCAACEQTIFGPDAHYATCDNPTVCWFCGYTGTIELVNHSGNLEWKYTETGHWQVCAACEQTTFGPDAHYAACNNPGVCEFCGYEGEMDIIHYGEIQWEHNETEHWQVCAACEQTIFGPDAHYATCDNPTVCWFCDYTGTIELVNHSGNLEWKYTETEHWQVCTACGQTVWGPYEHHATCENPTVCMDCSYTGPIATLDHYGDWVWEYNGTHHWWACSLCHAQMTEPEIHFAYCPNNTTCMTCGYQGDIAAVDHQGNVVLQNDENEHWFYCTICGDIQNREPHAFVDGVCSFCAYQCPHTNAKKTVEQKDEAYIKDYSGTDHYLYYVEETTLSCDDCGYVQVTESPYYGPSEPCHFVDGKCDICGNECTHWMQTHYNTLEEGVRDIDEVGHTSYNTQEIYEECMTCGLIQNKRTEQNVYRSAHYFRNGACDSCGYVNTCTHPEFKTSYHYGAGGSEVTYSDPDQNGHIATGYAIVVHECTTCGEAITEVEAEITSRREKHAFGSDGICYICGYQNPCTHPNPVDNGRNFFYAEEATSQGKEGHEITARFVESYSCPDCGYSWSVMEDELTTVFLPHEYFDGYCGWCDYFCPHEAMETQVAKENLAYSNPNADGHTVSYQEKTTTLCPDCGRTRTAIQDVSLQEAHQMADGKCMLCGYEAPQSGETPTVEPTQQPTQAPTTEPTQQPTQAPTTEPTQQPTQAPTAEPTQPSPTPVVTPAPEEDEEDEAPVRPVSTATPTATPEPVFTQAPENEVVHGVKVEDRLPMVDTMLTVVSTIVTERATSQIQIVNFDKILTVEENTVITQMKPQEQLLTFLAVIGIDTKEDGALAQAEISEEALAVQSQIKQRIDAMSEADRAAFEASLTEYFPVETIVVDGQEYTWFTIDLEIRDGDTIRIERYGFRLEDGEWIFAKLEIAA